MGIRGKLFRTVSQGEIVNITKNNSFNNSFRCKYKKSIGHSVTFKVPIGTQMGICTNCPGFISKPERDCQNNQE